jgi:protein phosphatase 1G
MGIYLSKASVDMETEEGRGNGMQFCVGDIQGWRKNMEDAHLASLEVKKVALKECGSVAEKEDMSIFGVFDGHGGKEVAKFAQIKFVREFVRGKAFAEQRYMCVHSESR